MKKEYFFIILFICFSQVFAIAQKKNTNDSTSFFNAIEAGPNYSFNGSKEHANKNIGFGFDAMHIFRKDKIINILAGVGFTLLRSFYKTVNQPISSSKSGGGYFDENVTNRSLSLFIPLYWRVNFGKKTRFFLFQGLSASITILDYEKGTRIIKNKPSEFNKLYYLDGIMGGPTLGCGLRIPIKKHELSIRNCWNLNFYRNDNSGTDIFLFSSLSIGIQF